MEKIWDNWINSNQLLITAIFTATQCLIFACSSPTHGPLEKRPYTFEGYLIIVQDLKSMEVLCQWTYRAIPTDSTRNIFWNKHGQIETVIKRCARHSQISRKTCQFTLRGRIYFTDKKKMRQMENTFKRCTAGFLEDWYVFKVTEVLTLFSLLSSICCLVLPLWYTVAASLTSASPAMFYVLLQFRPCCLMRHPHPFHLWVTLTLLLDNTSLFYVCHSDFQKGNAIE